MQKQLFSSIYKSKKIMAILLTRTLFFYYCKNMSYLLVSYGNFSYCYGGKFGHLQQLKGLKSPNLTKNVNKYFFHNNIKNSSKSNAKIVQMAKASQNFLDFSNFFTLPAVLATLLSQSLYFWPFLPQLCHTTKDCEITPSLFAMCDQNNECII